MAAEGRPSIAELQRLESLMRLPQWLALSPMVIDRHDDVAGVVALRNAAPVLLEIAAAALAYEQAKIDAAAIRYAYANADDRRTTGARHIEAHDRDEIRCREDLRAALAKVVP